MSAEPSTVSSAVAKKTNASKWPVFKKILGNLDDISRFTETTDRLTVYLRNHRAYYQDARPEVSIIHPLLFETLNTSTFEDSRGA